MDNLIKRYMLRTLCVFRSIPELVSLLSSPHKKTPENACFFFRKKNKIFIKWSTVSVIT